MPFSDSNTGSTDLRDTEVQQPNTAATLSTDSNCLAFSANSGQLEAGSTTTASSLRPITPPFLFCSSISISITSLSGASLIAIVPDKECRMPTLIGPVSGAAVAAFAWDTTPGIAPTPVAAAARPRPRSPSWRRSIVERSDDIRGSPHILRRPKRLPAGRSKIEAKPGGGTAIVPDQRNPREMPDF